MCTLYIWFPLWKTHFMFYILGRKDFLHQILLCFKKFESTYLESESKYIVLFCKKYLSLNLNFCFIPEQISILCILCRITKIRLQLNAIFAHKPSTLAILRRPHTTLISSFVSFSRIIIKVVVVSLFEFPNNKTGVVVFLASTVRLVQQFLTQPWV